MRLIDAHKVQLKLLEECQNIRYFDKDRKKPQIFADGIDFAWVMLDNAPTVKAIPIDYIEKWIDARARIIKINPPAFRELLATKLLDDWLAGREPDWPIKFEVEENETNRRG